MEGAEAWSAPGEGDRARVGVVCVHGFTGNPISMRPLGEHLAARGHAVEVPRLPGHGTTVEDMARTRYADWIGELERVHADLAARCDHVVLVGLSMGGLMVLDLASRRDVAGVVAINAPILDRRGILPKLAPLVARVVATLPREAAGLPPGDIARPGADERAYDHVPLRAAVSLAPATTEVRERLRALVAPLLVAYSPQDHSVPPENSTALPGLVGSDDVEVLRLERSYHVATLDWDAEVLFDAVAAFVDRVAGED